MRSILQQLWCSTSLQKQADSSQPLFNSPPHEQFKYSYLFKMRKLKWLKGMKSLFIKHEYFIPKSTNETKHSHNISSAGIKDTLLPSVKPNLSYHNFNQKPECFRWCLKDKQAGVKSSLRHRQPPFAPTHSGRLSQQASRKMLYR